MASVPVVVGVDDTADARSAVLWAAQEAVLARTSLLIVHAPRLPPAGVAAGYLGAALRASDDVGHAVVAAAVALARANEPEVVVRALLSHADPAQALIDVSAEAHLLVLGSRHSTMGELSLLASKRMLVSAHAHCPVLLLGPVSTFSRPRGVARIVVGASNSRAGRAAVAFATAEAVRRDVALQLVQLELAPAAGSAGPARHTAVSVRPTLTWLDAELRAIRQRHPGLRVTAESDQGEAAELLPLYSDSSTILVVGCHHSEDHWSTRLGPVATSVVHRNRGAVVVVGYTGEFRSAGGNGVRS